jgi:4'-phosphopantetheinyl transferase
VASISPHASINDADDSAARLDVVITDEERERRDRFRQPDDRRRFARARGLLRSLLGQLLESSSLGLTFVTGASGKPALPSSADGPARLRFNVSHSHEWILIVLALDREVGVDVEHEQPRTELLDLARRFFSPWEVAALEALPVDCHDAAFYRTWACKESFVKAIGRGLPVGLDRFSTRGAAVGAASIELVWEEQGDEGESSDWTIRLLDVGPDYAAAVAVEGAPARLSLYEWR